MPIGGGISPVFGLLYIRAAVRKGRSRSVLTCKGRSRLGPSLPVALMLYGGRRPDPVAQISQLERCLQTEAADGPFRSCQSKKRPSCKDLLARAAIPNADRSCPFRHLSDQPLNPVTPQS